MKGFRKFILRGNLVDLAVAVVIGTQFSTLVKQFVDSFISPLLSMAGGQPNFNGYALTIRHSKFTYGACLTQALAFAIAAAVVYFLIVLPWARRLQYFERDESIPACDCPDSARSS